MKLEIAVEKVGEGIFRVGGPTRLVDAEVLGPGLYSLIIEGRSCEVSVREEKKGFVVGIGAHLIPIRLEDPLQPLGEGTAPQPQEGEAVVSSPMPGRVVGVKVSVGQSVKAGEGVVLVEAMKMENELHSPKAGKISKISVKVGDAVEAGQELAVIE